MTGQHDGEVDSPTLLDDASADFLDGGVLEGHTINNDTDGSSGTITVVASKCLQATLTGGVNNFWVIGDQYTTVP